MKRMVNGALRIVLLAAVAGGCAADPASRASSAGAGHPDARGTSTGSVGSDWFVERAAELGLDFVHFNGASGHFYYPEILPPGVGLLDYDNDGDLDVFLVQGRMLGPDANVADALIPPASPGPLTGRLYRNDLEIGPDGSRSWRFVDVTEQSGLQADGYGFGVAAGDIHNDGWVDLLVTSFESERLFRNDGDGSFTDVTDEAGIEAGNAFGVSAAFVDYDRDGWLDLYIGNNVDYGLDNRTVCPNTAGARDYCPPETYGGLPDRLYRNRGDGTFEDVSPTALRHVNTGGVSRATLGRFGPALGVATADYDGDGWLDIYVANDGTENLLWINRRDGTLMDAALLSGAALSGLGTPEAGMGVDAGDFDDDGDEDLFMTHLTTEGNNLYVNDGSGMFRDESAASRLGPGSLPYTGWGSAWFDFDNDGRLDVMAVNGTVVAVDGREDDPFPYGQRNTLFRNLGDRRFEDVTDRGRRGVRAVRGEPRGRVRRPRQRRGRGRAGRQQHRSRSTARQHDRQPPALAGPAAGGGCGRPRVRARKETCWARGWPLSGTASRRVGGVSAATAAMHRPTTRACSWGSAGSAATPDVQGTLAERTYRGMGRRGGRSLRHADRGAGTTPAGGDAMNIDPRAGLSCAFCLAGVLAGGCDTRDSGATGPAGSSPAAAESAMFPPEGPRAARRHDAGPRRHDRAGGAADADLPDRGARARWEPRRPTRRRSATPTAGSACCCWRQPTSTRPRRASATRRRCCPTTSGGRTTWGGSTRRMAISKHPPRRTGARSNCGPNDLAARVVLADVLFTAGDLEAAEQMYSRALERHPDAPAAQVGLGARRPGPPGIRGCGCRASSRVWPPPRGRTRCTIRSPWPSGGSATRKGPRRTCGFKGTWRSCRRIHCGRSSTSFSRARTPTTSGAAARSTPGTTRAAADLFRRGLELDPDDPSLRQRLGVALFQLGDVAGARQAFERVVQTAPEHTEGQFSLGRASRRSGTAPGGDRALVDRAAARPGLHPGAGVQLAQALARTGRPGRGALSLRTGAGAGPDPAGSRLRRRHGLRPPGALRRGARPPGTGPRRETPRNRVFQHALARILASAPDAGVRDGERAMAILEPLLAEAPDLSLGETTAMALAEMGLYSQAAAVQRDILEAARQAGLADAVWNG